jgi:hypothetical protein
MSYYKTIYTDVQVDVDLSEWEDEELLEELKSRNVDGLDAWDDNELLEKLRSRKVDTNSPTVRLAIDWYNRGNIKETLHYLEMAFPELHGLSEKVKNEYS